MRAYLAGPFFSPEQIKIVDDIAYVLRANGIEVYSPKDDNLFKPGMSVGAVLDENVKAIDASDFIVAITDGKDVGTMFEAGYAYATSKDILYVWLGHKPGMKFNLMLAASGNLALSLGDLEYQIQFKKNFDVFDERLGDINDADIE
jgi:nucleoside 2-deoxyribosyltransferase